MARRRHQRGTRHGAEHGRTVPASRRTLSAVAVAGLLAGVQVHGPARAQDLPDPGNIGVIEYASLPVSYDNPVPAPGVEYILYRDGAEVARARSGEDGFARFTGLPLGKYTVEASTDFYPAENWRAYTDEFPHPEGPREPVLTPEEPHWRGGKYYNAVPYIVGGIWKEGKRYSPRFLPTLHRFNAQRLNLDVEEYTATGVMPASEFVPDPVNHVVPVRDDGTFAYTADGRITSLAHSVQPEGEREFEYDTVANVEIPPGFAASPDAEEVSDPLYYRPTVIQQEFGYRTRTAKVGNRLFIMAGVGAPDVFVPGMLMPVNVGFGLVGTGVIGDRIFRDVDGNGADDGEPGIAGAVVTLVHDGEVLASTTTAENGSYRFDELEPGEYTVTVDPASLPLGLTRLTTPERATLTLVPEAMTSDGADLGFAFAPAEEAPAAGEGAGDEGTDGEAGEVSEAPAPAEGAQETTDAVPAPAAEAPSPEATLEAAPAADAEPAPDRDSGGSDASPLLPLAAGAGLLGGTFADGAAKAGPMGHAAPGEPGSPAMSVVPPEASADVPAVSVDSPAAAGAGAGNGDKAGNGADADRRALAETGVGGTAVSLAVAASATALGALLLLAARTRRSSGGRHAAR